MRRPDFTVIGAVKAGTTALAQSLASHPGVYIPPQKELPYFAGLREQYDRYWSDAGQYHDEFFRRAPVGAICGSVTPAYMAGVPRGYEGHDPHEAVRVIPRRLFEFAPAMRLVAVLRDPAERAISHHRMNVLLGLESRTFEEMVAEELSPDRLADARLRIHATNSYIVMGEYGRILSGYLDVFPTKQMLAIRLADERPRAPWEEVLAFLGADPVAAASGGAIANVGAARRRHPWLSLWGAQSRLADIGAARSAWRAIPVRVRRPLVLGYARLALRESLWNRVEGPAPRPHDAVLAALRAHYTMDAHVLDAVLRTIGRL